MPGKRVLFFGTTGIAKAPILSRFKEWSRQYRNTPQTLVDFERDYLFKPHKGGAYPSAFLDLSITNQYRVWRDAWSVFRNELPRIEAQAPDADTLICLHGCVTRSHYGVRSTLDPRVVADIEPTHIVTFIDDVYDVWWRTQIRAGNIDSVGIPTLEHLIQARRAELIIADQVAHVRIGTVPNLLISASHPFTTLWNWLYGKAPKVTYLSFPISQPRRLERSGDSTGLSEVNAFLGEAYKRQAENSNLVFICPLGIDELPLRAALRNALDHNANLIEIKDKRGQPIEDEDPDSGQDIKRLGMVFDREQLRWNLDSIWPPHERLSPGPPPPDQRPPVLVAELRTASGIILSDVTWRDYRLVEQSRFLAVFNPRFRGSSKVSRGVLNEIQYATDLSIDTFVFQDVSYDPEQLFDESYPRQDRGTITSAPITRYVHRCDSIQDVFNEIERIT